MSSVPPLVPETGLQLVAKRGHEEDIARILNVCLNIGCLAVLHRLISHPDVDQGKLLL
jgi:hypothetical protein